MNRLLMAGDVFGGLLVDGLTVAAWVALWEALATFFIEWPPFRRKLRLYEGLATAEVMMTITPAGIKERDGGAAATAGQPSSSVDVTGNEQRENT